MNDKVYSEDVLTLVSFSSISMISSVLSLGGEIVLLPFSIFTLPLNCAPSMTDITEALMLPFIRASSEINTFPEAKIFPLTFPLIVIFFT